MMFDLRFYMSLLMRRLPVMLALILICSAIGIVTALNLPPVYQTTARLLVEDAQINLGNGETVDAAEQLQVIEQRLMTRANMIDIARKFRVFEDIEEMTPDLIVQEMVAQTRIRRTSGRGQATLMTVSFSAVSGVIAANVLNEYLSLIQEEASATREEKVDNTLSFFEQEVERLGADLDQQSARIVEFKNQNANALPDDLEFRLGRQTFLQERLSRLERERASTVRQREDLIEIFSATGRTTVLPQVQLTPQQAQLVELELELNRALAIYSETNPKVTLLRSRIEQLERAQSGQISTGEDGSEPLDPQNAMLEASLAELSSRLLEQDDEISTTIEELAALAESIAATSSNGIALTTLERDFTNIQNRYNAAVNSLDQARVDERIELSSRGQRVTVIEGASVPQDPTGPNRPRIAIAGIASGLGLAGLFFFLLEMLNRKVRRPAEIEAHFNITPIAAIPYMESRREKMIRRSLLVTAVAAVLIAVPIGLWYVDTNIIPLELIAEQIIERIR